MLFLVGDKIIFIVMTANRLDRRNCINNNKSFCSIINSFLLPTYFIYKSFRITNFDKNKITIFITFTCNFWKIMTKCIFGNISVWLQSLHSLKMNSIQCWLISTILNGSTAQGQNINIIIIIIIFSFEISLYWRFNF